MCLKTKKEGSLCPKCAQTCSRRWNLMIHIDRRHPEIGGEANPIRQAHNSANIPNYTNGSANDDSSRALQGWKYQLTRNNLNTAGLSDPHIAHSPAMTIHNTPIESLLRQYEEDRQEELTTKRRENERIHSRELFEVYQTLKINEIENRKRMGGNLGSDMNEVSSLIAAGILTPVISTDKEGTISIRLEPTNRENVVNTLSTNQNNLSGPLLQGMLAIFKKQAEFADNMIKYMEMWKRKQDVRDEELARMLIGGVKDSQANYSKAEQLRIEHKPEVVSRVLSGGGEKNDSLHDGQEEKSSRKELGQTDFVNLSGPYFEMSSSNPRLPPPPPVGSALFHIKSTSSDILSEEPEPLAMLIEDDEKKRRRPDQQSSRLIRPQEHFSSSQDYGVQQVRLVDEQAKEEEDQRFIEGVKKMQIRAKQEKNSKKKERSIFG
jgi:hypothetical protein